MKLTRRNDYLQLAEVQASIAEARPMLSGEFGGYRFDVAGSPLRD